MRPKWQVGQCSNQISQGRGEFKKEEKLSWLSTAGTLSGVTWRPLHVDSNNNWLVSDTGGVFAKMIPIGIRARDRIKGECCAIFEVYSSGVKTNADAYVYGFDNEQLSARARAMVEDFNTQLDRWKRSGEPDDVEGFVKVDPTVSKWIRNTKRTLMRGKHLEFSDEKIRTCLYRPFTKQAYNFERAFSEDTYQFSKIFPTPDAESENRIIGAPGPGGRALWATIIASHIANLSLTSLDSFQYFPFYVYDEDGTNRRENITDWALKQFRDHYHDKKIDKWAIFHYVYGLLHHPGYREKFADNLKRELPRIPLAPDFRAFAKAGKKLADLHLDYEQLKPWDLEFVETPGVPLSYRVDDKMRLNKDKTELKVNASLTLAGIPLTAFEYRLGNRSALDWVIDQYQVSTDKRSGITSDPNRDDDPEYIVRLVGQVIRVSLETVAIVNQLPTYSADDN